MKDNYKSIIVIIMLLVVFFHINNKNSNNSVPSINNPVVTPIEEPKPEIVTNIIFEDINKAKELSSKHKRKLLLIFGADWCPYCKVLKKDISVLNTNEYIVCVIDTDKNSKLVDEYRIKGLPTSIAIDNQKELSRKVGYKKDDYQIWLGSNQEAYASWIEPKE
jgi:thiol-disulfide isomerase/thioredoxin